MAPSNKVNRLKFAKFCFEVIKNECKNIKRAAGNRKDHNATGEEPVEYLIELLAHEDTYPVEHLVLTVGGKSCAVESEILYEALKSLPDEQREVILYDFWLELKDGELDEHQDKGHGGKHSGDGDVSGTALMDGNRGMRDGGFHRGHSFYKSLPVNKRRTFICGKALKIINA